MTRGGVMQGARGADAPVQLSLPLDPPPAEPSPPEWTEHDVAVLREGILIDSLKTLLGIGGRASAKRRQEDLEWMLDDSIHPFSFRVCALAVGCDPDELRQFVIRRLKEEGEALPALRARSP